MLASLICKNRPCPFCLNESSSVFGVRGGTWVRCRKCRSVFRDITLGEFQQLHDEAWNDHTFVESTVAANGLEAAHARWAELSLPGTSVLEIGPGSGHLLAAAHQSGRVVTAVETSEIHRAFIHETWGIDSLYADLGAIPESRSFDAIVGLNVLEHVYDVKIFLRSIARLLTPGGIIFISTVNAEALEAAALKGWWSMCKEHDHVSFPSAQGMVQAARASSLEPERVWSTELAFEFPISALVSVRDWRRERRGSPNMTGDDHPHANPRESTRLATKSRLSHFYSISAPFDPTSRLLGALGRAATVKARLRPTTLPRTPSEQAGPESARAK